MDTKRELTEFEREMEQDVTKPLAISISTPSKTRISQVATNIIDQCRNGEIDALELIVKVSALEKILEIIREGVAENVLKELNKYQGKTSKLGAQVIQKELGVKYDYSESEAWKAVKEMEDKLSTKRKEIEKMAQLVPEGTQVSWTDKDSGETLSITKAAKSSKTGFAVTLEK